MSIIMRPVTREHFAQMAFQVAAWFDVQIDHTVQPTGSTRDYKQTKFDDQIDEIVNLHETSFNFFLSSSSLNLSLSSSFRSESMFS